jgi:ABC-type sugar transport system ATPase subunit
MINFPVIRKIEIKNYDLYRGENNDGILAKDMLPGVNLIVGVNGIGKTTLLTMLLRALTGLKDLTSGGSLGRGARKADIADKQYFARRVRDNAANATVKVEIHFGTKVITIERQLKNLAITFLKVGNLEVRGDNAQHFEALYEQAVIEASGLATTYDYLLVLRFICFFLEDRQPLIWDKNAQYEVLRALFSDRNIDPRAYFEAYNKMTSLDSEFRNQHAAISRMKARLDKAIAAKAQVPELANKLTELIRLSDELTESLTTLDEQESEARKTAYEARRKLESAKFDLQLKRTELAGLQKAFLAGLFGTAEADVAHRVLQTLMHGKCTVCGSTDATAIATLRENSGKGLCPVCHTPHELHEHAYGQSNSSITQKIHEAEVKINSLASQINALENESLQLTEGFYELSKKTSHIRIQLHGINVERAELSRQLGKDSDAPKMSEDLRQFKEIEDDMLAERKAQELIVKGFLEQVEQEVNARWQSIAQRFKMYISGFMAESCSLLYKLDERTLLEGQTDVMVGFPLFSVRLTSGVFEDEVEAPPRDSITEVSESQREFIDLAFRMAIIAEVANDRPSMLVIETPEASLDSVFVPRAGEMIRNFINRDGDLGLLIASVNLNREAMIPALFGVPSQFDVSQFEEQKDWSALKSSLSQALPHKERERHIINLLAAGAGNAALKKHTDEYAHEYKEALRPSWEEKAITLLSNQG